MHVPLDTILRTFLVTLAFKLVVDLTMKPEEDSVAATSPMLERNHNEITERTPFLDDRLRNRTNTSVSRLVPAMKAEGSVEEDLANRLLFFASSFLTSPLSAYLKEETVMTNIAMFQLFVIF